MLPHRASFTPHPLASLAAAFAVGILLAHIFSLSLSVELAFAAGTLFALLWCLRKARTALASVSLVLATLVSGAALESIEKRKGAGNQLTHLLNEGMIADNDPVELSGTVEGPRQNAPDGFYVTLHVEQIRFKSIERYTSGVVELLMPVRNATVRSEYESLELRHGARISVITALERSDNYRNPGVSSFTEFLQSKGDDATGVIKSPLLIEHQEDTKVFLPLAWLYQWHEKLETEINNRFPKETAGVLDAALLGNRYNLSREAADRFRAGGTFHVLVINGLHITFIGGVIWLLVRRVTKKRLWQFGASVVALWSYALAVGAEASVVRATLMFTFVALAPVISRRATSLNALGGAALFLLVRHPGDLFDPSFQLTFLSVLAIILIGAPLLQKMEAIGRWQPSQETPHPPVCPRWLRALSETLFWSERRWQEELAHASYSYRIFKAPLAARLEHYHLQPLLRYAMGAVVISASVQLGLLPLLVLYFHRVSPAALILNIGVGALMALLGLVALLALVMVQISSVVAAPLIGFANSVNWLMVHSIDLFSLFGGASVRLPEYTGWPAALYALYYVPLALLAIVLARWNPLRAPRRRSRKRPWDRPTRIALVVQLFLLLLIVFHPLSAAKPDGKLRVDFLDVGQGDAALVTMPDGTTLLIDGGGRTSFTGPKAVPGDDLGASNEAEPEAPFTRDTRSIGEAVVSEYLWWRGLDGIDYILATHADADHIDGLNDVARNFKVRAAFVARTPRDDPEYAKFAATMRDGNVPIKLIAAGDVLHFGAVTATVMWPAPDASGSAPSQNNDSIVLRLQCGERRILMTGDVEKEGETAILNSQSDLRADVVKVAHHGSKTSSTAAFVAATRARLAVVSVGQTSIFGHPNKDVVERWRARGAEVMTTGKHGTITVKTDGKDLGVQSFAGPN